MKRNVWRIVVRILIAIGSIFTKKPDKQDNNTSCNCPDSTEK